MKLICGRVGHDRGNCTQILGDVEIDGLQLLYVPRPKSSTTAVESVYYYRKQSRRLDGDLRNRLVELDETRSIRTDEYRTGELYESDQEQAAQRLGILLRTLADSYFDFWQAFLWPHMITSELRDDLGAEARDLVESTLGSSQPCRRNKQIVVACACRGKGLEAFQILDGGALASAWRSGAQASTADAMR